MPSSAVENLRGETESESRLSSVIMSVTGNSGNVLCTCPAAARAISAGSPAVRITKYGVHPPAAYVSNVGAASRPYSCTSPTTPMIGLQQGFGASVHRFTRLPIGLLSAQNLLAIVTLMTMFDPIQSSSVNKRPLTRGIPIAEK